MTSTDKVIANTADRMMDNVEALAKKIEALAMEHGAAGWDMALAVARVDALSMVVSGFIFVGLAILCSYVVVKANRRFNRNGRDQFSDFIIMVGGPTLSVGCGIYGLPHLLSTWAWVGIFYPELWIASKLLDL